MIRNFVIIAHIDHGKSTLADRFLEVTRTVAAHKMQAQYLDQMDLERERGITISMAPVRMAYKGAMLNLIDTPGHCDFSYEVSRALNAVEGAILLVDATQGIQAQTLANFKLAQEHGLKVIGAINKIDMNPAGADAVAQSLAHLIGVDTKDIFRVSGKTGQGVSELLDAVVAQVPEPKLEKKKMALIFNSRYDDHKGVIACVRVFGGSFKRGDDTQFCAFHHGFKIKEVGYFSPQLTPCDEIKEGEIGYIATGIKDPDAINIGDTIGDEALPGFHIPKPAVYVSLYPGDAGDYDDLRFSMNKLRLMDSALNFSPDFSTVLGRGFKCGFLGKLHFEITIQRLEQEFDIEVISSFPSVAYRVKPSQNSKSEFKNIGADGFVTIENPKDFPNDYDVAEEPMIRLHILTPQTYLGQVLGLSQTFRMDNIITETEAENIYVHCDIPLSELISDFDDRLKSISAGFASFSYESIGYRRTEVVRLDILVANEQVPGLSRIVHKNEYEREARNMVSRLKDLLPQQMFSQAIQASVGSKIVARETIVAAKKDLGIFGKNGGDRTRKMKLWKKQKEGKKRLQERGKVSISPEIFKELLKK